MKKNIYLLVLAIVAISLSSCSKYRGYDKTENGLYYKFYSQSEDAQKPQMGDVLTLTLVYKTDKDSILEDSRLKPYPFMLILRESQYKGDIYDGLSMMHLGDSVSFILRADSFYMATAGFPELPAFVTPDMMLYFDCKLAEIKPRAQFEKEMAEMQKKYAEEMEVNKDAEPELIKKYVTDNNIKAKPTASGLYYVEVTKGTGAQAANGMSCTMHYKGSLLDGRVFDSSEGKEPFTFKLGEGQVIKGWDEGVAKMKVGGKAKFVIPSTIAYGEKGAGQQIPPYAPLVFEVELLDAK